MDAQLAEVERLIGEQRYNEAVAVLTRVVACDREQLDRAERYFDRIREIREQYVLKGFEVRDALQTMISEETTEEQLIPRALQALALIAEMSTIIPFPNFEELRLVASLESRILLTVDQRRFQLLMAQAAEASAPVDGTPVYAEAVRLYTVGPDPEIDLSAAVDAEAGAFLLERLRYGLDLQREYFESQEYGLVSDLVTEARELVRRLAVIGEPDGLPAFTAVAGPAQQEAERLMELFGAGNFSGARNLVEAYLPTLDQVSTVHRRIEEAAQTIAAQESVNASRASQDPAYVYDNHIRFVNDLVNGRPGRSDEGIRAVAGTVRSLVTDGPVNAARAFGEAQYRGAVAGLTGFSWRGLTAPAGTARVSDHVREAIELLATAAGSYRAAVDIYSVARALDIEIPPPRPNEPASVSLLPLFALVEERLAASIVEDDEIAGTREAILEAAVRTASAEDLTEAARIALQGFTDGSALRSQTQVAPLQAQRTAVRGSLAEMTRYVEGWSAFESRLVEAYPERGAPLMAAAAPSHSGYLAARVGQLEEYELAVVREIARIEIADLQNRLTRAEASIASARQDLAATITVAGVAVPRPRTDSARNALVPLVGTVSGTTIVSAATGELERLRTEATALAQRLIEDVGYVSRDAVIQGYVARANQVAATVGTVTAGTLQTARNLLQDALNRIAGSEEALRLGQARIPQIREAVAGANAAADSANLALAGQLIRQASELLSSESAAIRDASELFTESLELWYRAPIERQWETDRTALVALIQEAQGRIVYANVTLAVNDAEPLIQAQEWLPALDVLEPAFELWNSAFPQQQHPRLTPLLRLARTAEAATADRALREDVPGFERLSQLLSTAYGAYQQQDLDTARQALTIFFTEQPRNFDARLLEARIGLSEATGDRSAVVRRLVDAALAEGEMTDAVIRAAAQTGVVPDSVYNAALPLEPKLEAIRQVIQEVGGVSAVETNRIAALLRDIDAILRPPPPRRPEELAPAVRAEADRLINESIAFVNQARALGALVTLPPAQRQRFLELLDQADSSVLRALVVAPNYRRALDQQVEIDRLRPPVGSPVLPPEGEAVYARAGELRLQRDVRGAVGLMEEYLRQNPSALYVPKFMERLDQYRDILRRGG